MSYDKKPNSVDKKVAAQVVKLRIASKITASETAYALCITEKAYADLEAGTERFRASQLFTLSSLFRTPIATFFETLQLP